MSNDATVEVAGLPASSESELVNQPELNTPEATAADGVVEEKQVEQSAKTFTQAEVDALIQKRLLKEERRVHRRIEQQLRQSQQAEALKEPKREAFGDDQAYLQAQVEHLAEKKAAEKLEERKKAEEAERRHDAFLEKAEKAAERYPDFQAVVSNPSLPISEAMAEFIAESDQSADLAYHLGKNPMKAAQIAQMSPIKAARELARIETELSQPPKTSNAPPPINPIGSNKSSGQKDPADMSPSEFAKWRKEQIARRGR
jgi:hypothetical protein